MEALNKLFGSTELFYRRYRIEINVTALLYTVLFTQTIVMFFAFFGREFFSRQISFKKLFVSSSFARCLTFSINVIFKFEPKMLKSINELL